MICNKMDLALNNLQRLIRHKPQTNQENARISNWCIISTNDLTNIPFL